MSKSVRVTLRNGETRLQELPYNMTLPQMWLTWKSDGAALGDIWCAQYDDIAHATIIFDTKDAALPHDTPSPPPSDENALNRMSYGVGVGGWKPLE